MHLFLAPLPAKPAEHGGYFFVHGFAEVFVAASWVSQNLRSTAHFGCNHSTPMAMVSVSGEVDGPHRPVCRIPLAKEQDVTTST